MMKRRFNVSVDGKTYVVEVEEVLDKKMSKTFSSPKPNVRIELNETPKNLVESGVVTAPLPGLVSKLNVKKGDRVEKNDMLLVLEAMKMENEIHSPSSGMVNEVYVKVGDTVGRGAPLVNIS